LPDTAANQLANTMWNTRKHRLGTHEKSRLRPNSDELVTTTNKNVREKAHPTTTTTSTGHRHPVILIQHFPSASKRIRSHLFTREQNFHFRCNMVCIKKHIFLIEFVDIFKTVADIRLNLTLYKLFGLFMGENNKCYRASQCKIDIQWTSLVPHATVESHCRLNVIATTDQLQVCVGERSVDSEIIVNLR
jgi:hypothetical protein